MRFSELAKYKDSTDLLISARHEEWMQKNANPSYSASSLEFARAALSQEPRDRKGSVSSSSLGSCVRRQQFTWMGMAELPPKPKLAAIFHNGTFMHIRWQMAGLTEGWLVAAEVPVGENPYQLSGTMDGILYEDSVVELKSTNSNGFRKVLAFGPLEGHAFQLGTYLLTTNREKGVFLYEDKDTQEFKELVMHRDQLPIAEIVEGAEKVWSAIHDQQLYEPLDDCMAKTGYRYHGCPFRDRCLGLGGFAQAQEMAAGR